MPTIVPSLVPDLQEILATSIGALLIGAFFSVCLFGANSLQTWYYYQHYPTDPVILKTTVALVWILEAVHAILLCHGVYSCVIQGFGDLERLGSPIWSTTTTVLVTTLLALTTRMFFTWRVYILSSRKRILVGIILVMALSAAVTTCVISGIALGLDSYADIPHSWEFIAAFLLIFGGVVDLLIASSLGYYLHHARSGIVQSDKLVNKLIFWAINVGILTSIGDFTVVGFIIGQHLKNLVFLGVFQVLSNLYAASMLATLNIRPFTRDRVLDENGTVIHFNSVASTKARGTTSKASDELRCVGQSSNVIINVS